MSKKDDAHSRRTVLASVVAGLFGYSAAQELQNQSDSSAPILGAGGAVGDGLAYLNNIVVGDDAESLLNSLNSFPKLMLDSTGGMRLLEEYEASGTEVITLTEEAQLIISDSLDRGKDQIDQYPALIIVRGSGATLVEET